jgi:fructose transport system ATP-binding protein
MTPSDATSTLPAPAGGTASSPVLAARNLVKRYGPVTALGGADFELLPGEVLAVIGDNGAGKSTLIKALSGALVPDEGEVEVCGRPAHFTSPVDARAAGIENVYQSLAVAPSLDIASNLFLGRETRRRGVLGSWLRMLDHAEMRSEAARHLNDLGIMTIQNPTQAVETLSGGQRQAVAVARAAAFGSRVVIMDEPTAALGVRESRAVLDLILEVRARGLSVILVSHDMPLVFEIAERIHTQRLGRRAGVVTPETHSMTDVVAVMTGAAPAPQ